MQKVKRISVVGDGSWGTTLSLHLANQGFQVRLWGAFPDNIRQIKKTRFNEKFLAGILLPPTILPTVDLEDCFSDADLIVLAVPSQHLRTVLKKFPQDSLKGKKFLSVVKGIETKTLKRVSQIVHDELGTVPLAVLSGPTIAMEVVHGIPTTAVIGAKNRVLAKTLQSVFNSKRFRIYTNTDIIGLELGGSLKNIIALACGVCDGLGFGSNTKAAILSRGLVEMSRLGTAMGARAKTFSGLAGLGDLVTTCVSLKSRNRFVGEQLGRGKSLTEIRKHMNMIAEGVATTQAAYRLSKKYHVPMPITQEVYKILYLRKRPETAVVDLMTREMKAE